MLTRALFALVLMTGLAALAGFQTFAAAPAGQMSLAEADSPPTQAKVAWARHHRPRGHPGGAGGGFCPPLPTSHPAVAYARVANLKKGDVVEIALVNGDTPLLHNTETLAEDRASYLLQAGKRGVPRALARRNLSRRVKVTRDAEPLIEQTTAPIAFE